MPFRNARFAASDAKLGGSTLDADTLGRALLTTKNGYHVELAAVGNRSAAELIEGQRKAEALLTWILRGVGTLLMFLGFALFLAPLSTMASVIPIFGRIVGGAAALVSLAIAVPLSILVIAFAWLAYRSILGAGLILLAIAVGYACGAGTSRARPACRPPLPPKQVEASRISSADGHSERRAAGRQSCSLRWQPVLLD